jgi:hypothetical protein
VGNRAVIAFGTKKHARSALVWTTKPTDIGIYLHWNGGAESVRAFLDATRELMKSRGPDAPYASARLIQVIGNYLGGTLSLGIGQLQNLDCDNGDNGVFIIDPEALEIVGRQHHRAQLEAKGFDQKYYEKVKAAVDEANRPIFMREGS